MRVLCLQMPSKPSRLKQTHSSVSRVTQDDNMSIMTAPGVGAPGVGARCGRQVWGRKVWARQVWAPGVGAPGVGAPGVGARCGRQVWARQVWAQGVGAPGVGAQGVGAQGVGAPGVGALPLSPMDCLSACPGGLPWKEGGGHLSSPSASALAMAWSCSRAVPLQREWVTQSDHG